MNEDPTADLDWLDGMKRIRRFPFPEAGPFVSPGQAEPDGIVALGWDQNSDFPAYRVARPGGGEVLVPFTPLAQMPPVGAEGDWYVEHFTDAAIKARWREASKDPETVARVHAQRAHLSVPHQFRVTGTTDPRGRIDANGAVDLRDIRRPGFFGQAPWNEPIAAADGATTIVEVAVPREPYEVLQMGLTSPIAIRGWHMAGAGVDDGRGGKVRALLVITAGRSIETTAIQHPDDPCVYWDEAAQGWLQAAYPDAAARTECWGAASWRNNYLYRFWQAGFDVLTFDKRGHGISGGDTDSNTNEQASDIYRALTAFEIGDGLRLLTPEGQVLAGAAAAGRLLAGYARAKDLPVFLSGASQGCMVSMWAMQKNFVGACDFDRPDPAAHGPLGYNVRGALLMAPFPGGLGYRSADDSLVEASRRLDWNVQMFATSEILANIDKWPSLFIGRGLWDFSESLEGSFEAYRRAQQPKRIVAVRGPHGENEWGQPNIDYMSAQMVDFARTVLIDPATVYPEVPSIRAIVEATPDHWPDEAWPKAGERA